MSTRTSLRFSPEEDDVLMDFVQKHPILYDVKHPEFKNVTKKDLIWEEAGEILNKSGSDCNRRWKSVRDHHTRERKREKASKGKATIQKRASYWERLGFLDMVDNKRKASTDISFTTSDELPTPTFKTDVREDEDSLPTTQEPEETSLQPIPQPTPSKNVKKCKKRRESVVSHNYSVERKENRDHYKKRVEEPIRQTKPVKEDATDLFFKTVAVTVKQFRPDLVTRTKAKIFEIVTKMELLNQQTPIPDPTTVTDISYNENMSSSSSSSSAPDTSHT